MFAFIHHKCFKIHPTIPPTFQYVTQKEKNKKEVSAHSKDFFSETPKSNS